MKSIPRTRIYKHALRILDRLVTPVVTYRAWSLTEQNMALLRQVLYTKAKSVPLILLARNVAQYCVSILFTPMCFLARLAGLRFLSVDLSQIGSLAWLDLYLRETKLKDVQPRAIFICRSKITDANPYLFEMYDRYVVYISNPFLKLSLSPFFVNPWFRDNPFRYQEPFISGVLYEEGGSFGYQAHREYNQKFGDPLIRMTESETRRGAVMMAQLLPVDKKFVAVHVRDSGFYGDTSRTTRNADIRTYESAFRYLIDRGYAVVRLGDPKMVPIDDMIVRCGPDLIDYARSPLKSMFLDIYLVSACDFFVGLSSGMQALPIAFNKQSCAVNCVNASACLNYLPGDLSTFKKILRIKDQSLVPFNELMFPPCSENLQRETLEQHGYYLEDNSEDEVLGTVREFVEGRGAPPTVRQVKAKSMIPQQRHSYGAPGDFSETLLKAYFPEFLPNCNSATQLN